MATLGANAELVDMHKQPEVKTIIVGQATRTVPSAAQLVSEAPPLTIAPLTVLPPLKLAKQGNNTGNLRKHVALSALKRADSLRSLGNSMSEDSQQSEDTPKAKEDADVGQISKIRRRRKRSEMARQHYSHVLEAAYTASLALQERANTRKLVLRLALHGILTCLSLMFVLDYLLADYYGYTDALVLGDFFLSLLFLVDLVVKFCQLSIPLSLYLTQIDNILDILTLLSPSVTLVAYHQGANGSEWSWPNLLNAARVLHFSHTFNIFRNELKSGPYYWSKYVDEVVTFVLKLTLILFICAGVILYTSKLQSPMWEFGYVYSLHFWDALYYSLVTFSTIGYGCIHPTTIASRLLMVCLILAVLFMFANQITGLSDVLQKFKQDPLGRRPCRNHVIVYVPSNDVRLTSHFLRLLSQGEHSDLVRFLLVGLEPLPFELVQTLQSTRFTERCLGYLQIQGVNNRFLQESHIDTAHALFILSNQHSRHSRRDDELATFFAREILQQYNVSVPTYLMVSHVEKKICGRERRIPRAPPRQFKAHTIHTAKLKFQLLAKNILEPGLIPLIAALLTDREQYLMGDFPSAEMYQHSVCHEVYERELPVSLVGKQFVHAVRLLCYGSEGASPRILLLGVIVRLSNSTPNTGAGTRTTNGTDRAISKLLLNPHKYTIKNGDVGFMLHFAGRAKFETLWQKTVRELSNCPEVGAAVNSEDAEVPGKTHNESKDKSNDPALVLDSSVPKNLMTNEPVTSTRDFLTPIERAKKGFDDKGREFEKVLKVIATHKSLIEDYVCSLKEKRCYVLNNQDLRDQIERHIVVCGFRSGLQYFVEALRQVSQVPIAILFEDPTPLALMKLLGKFKALYHFQGSPGNLSHLENAGVHNALHVVILANNNESRHDSRSNKDMKAVVTARLLQMFFRHTQYTIEMKEPESLELLDYVPLDVQRSLMSYTYWPYFMMGKVFISTILEALPSYMYHQRHFKHLVGSLIKNTGMGKTINVGEEVLECGALHIFPVPAVYTKTKRSYGQLFRDFLCFEYSLICLGLFLHPTKRRDSDDFLNSNEFVDMKHTLVPCLYLNPLLNTQLEAGTHVLCLGILKPDDNVLTSSPRKKKFETRHSLNQAKIKACKRRNFDKLFEELRSRLDPNSPEPSSLFAPP